MKKQPVQLTTQSNYFTGEKTIFLHNDSFIFSILSQSLLKKNFTHGQDLINLFTALSRTFLKENNIFKLLWCGDEYDNC